MGVVTKSIVIDAPVGTVWRFVTEPKNFPRYVQGYAERKISPQRTGVGARYEWYGTWGFFRLKASETIIRWKEKKLVAYRGKLAGIPFSSSMSFQKQKNDKTLLRVSIRYKTPLLLGSRITDLLFLRKMILSSVRGSLLKLQERFRR